LSKVVWLVSRCSTKRGQPQPKVTLSLPRFTKAGRLTPAGLCCIPRTMPRYFAQIDNDKKVLRVLVCDSQEWLEEHLGGTWVETFTHHETVRYCGIGHGFDPEWPEQFAPQWKQPTGSHDAYPVDTLVFHNGRIWKNLTPANVHAPGASGWRDTPAVGYPMWVQPAGAHDAYQLGDRVQHNNKVWQSTINANVLAPGTAALWIEVQ
jgi:hypothetical protein